MNAWTPSPALAHPVAKRVLADAIDSWVWLLEELGEQMYDEVTEPLDYSWFD